jgi:hypothetical protein
MIPTIIFVVVGTLLAPSKKRKVAFVFFSLSLLFSAGGLQLLEVQDFSYVFWLGTAAGIVCGALLGLFASLSVQHWRVPAQTSGAQLPSVSDLNR